MHDPRVKIDAPFLLPPSGSSCSVERLVSFSSSWLTCAVCVKVMGLFRERRMWESHVFLLFYGGVELFCDIVKSVVVVGDIVLVPVLVPVLVSAGMPSSWTWFFPTWKRRKTAWTQSWTPTRSWSSRPKIPAGQGATPRLRVGSLLVDWPAPSIDSTGYEPKDLEDKTYPDLDNLSIFSKITEGSRFCDERSLSIVCRGKVPEGACHGKPSAWRERERRQIIRLLSKFRE